MELKELELMLQDTDIRLREEVNAINNTIATINTLTTQLQDIRSVEENTYYRIREEIDEEARQRLEIEWQVLLRRENQIEEELQLQQRNLEQNMKNIKGLSTDYKYCSEQASGNIKDLKITTDVITKASSNKYGTEQLKKTLNAVKQRALQNKELIRICQKRIDYINSISHKI